MKDKNLLCCLQRVIIPLLYGIKYDTPIKIMEHHGNKVDVNSIFDFIFFFEGSRIHNC